MSPPCLAVVILNWNRWQDTCACVASVQASGYAPLRLIVVDNGSSLRDSTAEAWLRARCEWVQLPANCGFAAGVNRGLEVALAGPADYVMTLNNDAIIAPACLEQLVARAERHPHCGIVGPKILYRERPDRIWFAGGQRDRITLSTYGRGRGARDGAAFAKARRVNYLCAGAMLIRRAVFERVGLFNEGYFMYYEDCEWCLHTTDHGYQLWYEPQALVWHTVAASSGGEGAPLEHYFRTVSVFRFLDWNSRGVQRRALLALRTVLVSGQIARALFRGQAPLACALLAGMRDGLANRPVRPPL